MGKPITKDITTMQDGSRDSKGRFTKGHSGNPGGRIVDTLAQTAREILKEVQASGKTRQEMFVRKTLDDAFDGDPVARKLIWNYVDGMPIQKNEVTGKDGGALEVSTKLTPEQEKKIRDNITAVMMEATK